MVAWTTTCSGYGSETGASISGGGYSGYFAEPSWQTSTIGTKSGRGVPDVSMLGYEPGFWVYSTASNMCGTSSTSAGWFGCAGTSLSTPLWAGFLGVALQVKGGAGFGIINPLLYQLADSSSYSTIFHDITSGSNNGYSAGVGWDPVTGWGTPIANNLANALSSAGATATTTTSTTLLSTVSSTTSTTSWASTTSGSQTSTSSTTTTVSASPSITNTLLTTTTTTGSLASTSTTTFTSPLSTSYSTSSSATSSTTSYTETGTTTTGTSAETTTSTATLLSTTTSSGTATVTQTDTFNVLLTRILQQLNQFEALILQTLGFQVTATPVGQRVNRVVVTVTGSTSTVGQVTMTVSYSVAGGGSPTAPVFHYVLNGAAESLTLGKRATAVSVDAGSSWSVTPNPLSGSTSSQRWYSSQTLTGTASSTTIVFTFQHQYILTMVASGPGSVTPSSGWYNSGARVTIRATANSGHKFDSWTGSGTGSYTGTSASRTITMNAAISETATFT